MRISLPLMRRCMHGARGRAEVADLRRAAEYLAGARLGLLEERFELIDSEGAHPVDASDVHRALLGQTPIPYYRGTERLQELLTQGT